MQGVSMLLFLFSLRFVTNKWPKLLFLKALGEPSPPPLLPFPHTPGTPAAVPQGHRHVPLAFRNKTLLLRLPLTRCFCASPAPQAPSWPA
jgi:hypothetical protein